MNPPTLEKFKAKNISREERGGSQGTLQIRCTLIVEAPVHLL